MQTDPTKRPMKFLPWLAALFVGAALTLLAVVLYYQTGGYSEANIPLRWNGADLQVARGQATALPDDPSAFTIQAADARGVILWTPPRWISAGLYGNLLWKITGLDDRHPLYPIWRTNDGKVGQAKQATKISSNLLDLRTEPDWQGTIMTLGLFIPGPLASPLIVRQLELRPAALTAREWLEQLWREWTAREDWSQRSINFASGATARPLGSPVLLIAIWMSLSGLLYGGWVLAAGQRLRPAPFVALFLLGWLLLDLRWQWELSGRLEHTVERFAGKDATSRRLADLDGELYRFLLDIGQRLPKRPVRLFIVSADPGGFLAGRAHYHLLPHNNYMGFLRPPTAAHEGDYVLILSPLPEVRFNPTPAKLEWEDGQLAVERLYEAPLGALFRVTRNS